MYLKLLKLFLKENFSLKRLLGINFKKSKGKAIALSFALLYALGAYVGTFGYLFFEFGKTLVQINMIELLLMFAFVYASGLVILFTLFRSNGYLFHYKDYEILSPLPIKPRTVLFAKLSVMMIMVYFSVFLFLLPLSFAYFYNAGFNVISFLFYIIGIVVIPLIPTVIFSFISLGITRITSRFRGSKILTTVFLFVIFLGIMYLSFSFNPEVINPFEGQQAFIESFGKIYILIQWFAEAVYQRNIVSLLLLVSVSAVPFFLFFIGIQKMVVVTNQKGLSVRTRRNAKPAKSVTRSTISSLVQKELNKYLNVPIYALNTGLGPIMLLIMGVASLFFKTEIEGILLQTVGLNIPAELLVVIVISFLLSLLYTPAISLSLEGKNFWIIKSLPVSPEKVMFSKMIFNILLGLPVALISLGLLAFTFKISFTGILVVGFYITSFSLVTSALDSIINLYFPKFDYMNETEVVKQSLGALLGIFGNISFILIGGAIVYLLFDVLSWQFLILIASGVNFLLFFVFIYVVQKIASALFRKMSA